MEGVTPKISVIIPVRNESLRIRQCIEGILRQTVRVHEIIVIDSGSTDGTLEILSSFPQVTVIEIDGSSFNHGLTRNLGVDRSTGDFCLLTVGDAYAYDEHWIQHLLDGFVDDGVLAVCGQQVVDHIPENNPIDWFRPSTSPQIVRVQFNADDWKTLGAEEKKNAIGWDDVNAMYRRVALQEQPFEKTSYSEDAIWAYHTLQRGCAISYNKNARVFHYHNEDSDFAYKRAVTSHYFRWKLTGFEPKVHHSNAILEGFKLAARLFRYAPFTIKQNIFWWKYNWSRSCAYVRAQQDFNRHLKLGESALDAFHSDLCGKPPIPKKTLA